MTLNNPNIDIVNNNMYTKFSPIPSFFSYLTKTELELSEEMTIAPPQLYQRTKIYSALFEKLMEHSNPDVDLVNDNVYEKFG